MSENSEGVLFDYSATDPEDPGAEITRWSATGTDGGDFTINEDGELSFRNVPDFERPADSNRDNEYLVTVRASDGRYNGTLEVTVRVEAVNEAPEFRSGSTATFAYQENGTSDLYTYRATDPEGNDVAWGLSGTDRGAFEISETGVLSFIGPPDYENPTDSGNNNVYEATVEAGDGDGNTAGLEVTVTVTNLTDRLPVITGTAQVGQTLRADTSDIADAVGRTSVPYSYQWIRNEGETDTDIDGETDPTYTPSDSDVGKTLKVRVLFADDARNQKALTSEATAAVAAADNRAATGLPSISGTVQVEETLTANTSGIADEDELTNVSYSYQWMAGGSDIDGATGSTYTLTASQQGQTIQVRVSFTDDRNNAETLTSEATGAVVAADNRAATGLPTIGGTAQVGETLTADTTGIADQDGLDNATFSYQWLADDSAITDATGSTYTLVPGDQGKTIKVRVSFTDDANNLETLTSGATAAVAARLNSPATGAPAISDTAQVGETLTASTSDFADQDGLDNATFSYQWLADDSAITDATGSTYTLVPADEGKSIKVRVSFTDDADNEETLTSAATATVAAKPNTAPKSLPIISGTAQVDQTLTANTSDIADADGLTSVSYSYQWIRNDGSTDTDIAGEKSSTYTLVPADQGKTIKVKVSFTDDANNAEALTSAATVAVAAADNRAATGLPTISGTVQLDETLTADTSGIADEDGLTNVSYSYQWIAGGSDIDGATGSTYTLTASEQGQTIQVRVSFTDDRNNAEALTSEATGAVAAAVNRAATGLPTIGGTAQVEETLTADTTGIADEDGLTNVSYSYQWIRSNGTTDTDLAGEESSTYTLVAADEGKTIKVKVSFADDANNLETLTSGATAAVAARLNSPATGAPAISGTAQVGETLTADTTGIADADGLTNVSFSYQWIRSDGNTDTDIAGETDSTYTLVSADVGKTIKVKVSFTDDANNAETLTSEATGAVAAADNRTATGLPTIGGTAQVEETLTADTTGIADEDGLTNASYSYQWIRNDGSADADIQDTTGSTYTLSDDDLGKTIKVRVSFTDDASNGETLTSAATATVAAAANSPATGAPAISGTAQVEETLTADTSGIADEDGLDDATFAYQWIRNDGNADTDIQDATSSTYSLVYDDVGRTIKVRVSFTDDASHEETQTSAPTEAVTLLVWSATLTAGTRETHSGYNLLHSTGALSQTEFTLGGDDYTVKMVVEGDDGLLSFGLDRRLRTDFTLNVGGVPFSSEDASTTKTGFVHTYQWDKGTVDWSVGDEVELSLTVMGTPATGQPTISGTAQVGETLTADTSGIADADGLDDAVFSYQWIAGGTDIQDATSSTYTLDADDVGKTIKVRVSFTDDAGGEEALTSAATGKVAAAANNPATGAPTISGTAQVGETLTASTSGIADQDGLDNATFSYQWLADDSAIPNATGSTYTLVAADEGKTIEVKVSFADDANNLETLTSAATAAVAAHPNSPPTGLPTISGTVQVGETLTADTSGIADQDGLDNASFSYQWRADDSAITDATGSTYTLVPADKGKTIKVRVNFTDDADNEETLTSAATAAVAASPNSPATGAPTISGTAQVGKTLTASTSGIADQDGLDNATFSYQWLADDSAITDATGSTYTLTASEQGRTVQVRVSFTDDRNNAETLTSEATDTVEAAPVTTPLTASFQNVPASHDGQTSFIFELRLSEEPKSDFSYTTMRDHAFTVTGGSVTGARRLNPPSNTGWAVSVEPDSSGDVTVVLPLTTDCAAQGAICTGDGRKLSNRLEITVKGPPLTASFEIVPASHNGSDNFKFSIAFSEELETGFSYATLQDHAFTVEGGTAVGARRLVSGSNIRWEISVNPDSNGDVTIVLPATTDCDAQGAICADGDEKLSNRLERTVSGPGQ